MLERSTLFCQSKEKGHPFRVLVFKCDGAQFQRDCNASKNAGTQLSGKGNQGKSWSKSESSSTGRGKGKENNGKSARRFIWAGEGAIQVSKESGNVQTLKTIIQDLENLKSETSPGNQESAHMGQVCITETSLIHEEWSLDERNNDWSLDEWNDQGSCVG